MVRHMKSVTAMWKRLPGSIRFALCLCVVHFVLLLWLFQAHEIWRDEGRALNIVQIVDPEEFDVYVLR